MAFSYRFLKFYCLCFLFFISFCTFSQNKRVDSLSKLLTVEKTDTGKVKLMWQLASASNAENPDTALKLAQEALFKARSIHYTEGNPMH